MKANSLITTPQANDWNIWLLLTQCDTLDLYYTQGFDKLEICALKKNCELYIIKKI